MHTKYGEHAAARHQGVGITGLTAVGQIERSFSPCKRLGKCLLIVPNLFPDGVSDLAVPVHASAARVWIGELHFRQLLRRVHRKGANTHRVEQLEDSRVGPDAKRKRKQGYDRKRWTKTELPRAIPQVLPNRRKRMP